MQYIVFLLGAFLILFVNGFTIVFASAGSRFLYRDLLPSSVIGTCVLSIVVTVLYRWDIPPYVSVLYVTAISSVAIIVLFIFKNQSAFNLAAVSTRINAIRFLCV